MCLVPVCYMREKCNRAVKKHCALRRYFILEYLEKKKRYRTLSRVLTAAELKPIHADLYFWKGRR
jgi:hypothetical protein